MNEILSIGIDLGGTKIAIAVVDQWGIVKEKQLIATPLKLTPEKVIDLIATEVKKLIKSIAPLEVTGVGIGVAGQINQETGSVIFAPNLGWKDVSIKDLLSAKLHLPVAVTNDVRASAYGEWIYGAGSGSDDLLCLYVGTGIGGGIVSGGKMLVGSSNTAGEVGHIPIDFRGPPCTCGARGCFEAIAGGWGFAARARQKVLTDNAEGRLLIDIAGVNIEELSAKHVFSAYHEGNPLARLLVDELKEALVAGTIGLINAYNPATLILGGGILLNNPELIETIKEGVMAHALKAATKYLEILPSRLKGDGGVIGAAAFLRYGNKNKESYVKI